ncbi:MAG: helix-turn-helix domain-containing protein [Bacteroidota bacterium]
MESVGERLRALRNARNLTIPEVARLTGIGKGNLSDLENNKNNPGKINLVRLSEFYGVSADWILFGDQGDEKCEKINVKCVKLTVPNLELAALFSQIIEIWENGDEEMKVWVKKQLELGFAQAARELNKKKVRKRNGKGF